MASSALSSIPWLIPHLLFPYSLPISEVHFSSGGVLPKDRVGSLPHNATDDQSHDIVQTKQGCLEGALGPGS